MKAFKYICTPCNRRWYEPEQVSNERCRRCNAPAICINPSPIKQLPGTDCIKVWMALQLLRIHCQTINAPFIDFAQWAFGPEWQSTPMSKLPAQWRALHKEFNIKVNTDNLFESLIQVLDMYYIKNRSL